MIYLCCASDNPRRVQARIAATGRLSVGQPARWLFLGRHYLRAIEWQEGLGPQFQLIKYAEQLQELALEWRRPYLDWIAQLGAQHNNLVWWSSRLAERNTALDSLYHQICYLQIGLTYALGETPPVLIVAESKALLRTLAEHPMLTGRIRLLFSWRERTDWLKFVKRFILVWARELVDGVLAMREARLTRRGLPLLPLKSGKPRVVIHSCIDDTYFGADGTAHDRYFTVLPDELRHRGYDVVTMPWLFNLRRSRRAAFSWFRKQPDRYLIPEDFYTINDYIWAAWVVIRQAWLLRRRQVFQDLDVTKLVREACLTQSLDSGVAKFVRYYRLVQKWKRIGLKIDVFIDTFENMVSEKPQVMAFRRYMRNVMTVGFQHYVAPYPLWLCAYTTPAESAIAPHPDVIVCNSPWMAQLLVEEGFPAAKLRIGPSLRYLYMVSNQMQVKPETNTVLVVLPLEAEVMTELMYKLLGAFPSHENIHFLLKPHPMMPMSRWESLLNGRELPNHMEIVRGSLVDWLPKAACAVTSASTTALEIALADVPVVLVGRETDLDLNPLTWFPELDRPVYSSEELRAQVLMKLSLSPAECERLRNWAQRMRQECFSPISDATILAFVHPSHAVSS